MLPSIDPSEVGLTGLIWLFVSYGYVLYVASGLIGEGSELLLLVPSLAGLVGGVVLPLLGAVPDGAIILFSGLGSVEEAQASLSVGVGALAGSTIMLLTIPFALSVFGGAVDIDEFGNANYKGQPKLSTGKSTNDALFKSGVFVADAVKQGGKVMAITTIPYFLIQIPARFLHGEAEEVSKGEHWWALSGLLVCVAGLVYYMRLQLEMSKEGEDKLQRVAVMKKLLSQGKVSLGGALKATIVDAMAGVDSTDYQNMEGGETESMRPPPRASVVLRDVLQDAFRTYDKNNSGVLDKSEMFTFFRDFNEAISVETMDKLFKQFDNNGNGTIDFQEFIGMTFVFITEEEGKKTTAAEIAQNINESSEETEEIPEDFTDLSPEEQQTAIKKRAFLMLLVGTTLVVLFSDPMVDVMQQIANRANLSPFYVSFVLAPLASNASEVLASQYYASKKTRKTITVALSALEGAASMNNTFCLSIFMALIFFRGLAWQYTAETLAIVVVEFFMAYLVQRETLNNFHAVVALLIFPLSIALVAGLEALGFD